MHQFHWIYDWVIASALSPWALAVIFSVCMIDGFFPPVPSESVVTALAAVLIQRDPLRLIPLGLLAGVGAFLGDNVAYFIGSRLHHLLVRFPKFERRVHEASAHVTRRGATLIITGRFIPVGRVAINMGAGIAEYPHHRFMIVTAISATIWAGYSVAIGVVAGHWVEENPLMGATVGVVLGIALGTVVDRIIVMHQRSAAPAASVVDDPPPDDPSGPDRG